MSLIFSDLQVQGLALFSVCTAPDGLRRVAETRPCAERNMQGDVR